MTHSPIPSILLLGPALAAIGQQADAQQAGRATTRASADGPLVANAESDTFAVAEMLYNQSKDRNMDAESRRAVLLRAAELFKDYMRQFPRSEKRTQAQYLLAVCQSELGDDESANKTLASLANDHLGEYAAAAAYKLGTQASARSLWSKAQGYFQIVIRKTKRAEMKSDATYRLGRALLQLGRRTDAENAFRQLQVMKGVKPSIFQASLFSLAQMKTEDGKDEEAYQLYRRLISLDGVDVRVRGNATLQAARLAARLGKSAESQALYSQLTAIAGMEKYAGEAQMESILALYRNQDYEGITRLVAQGVARLEDAEQGARRALIVGQAYMELKSYDSASQWFGVVERAVPRTELAADAAYRRIVCAQQNRRSITSLAEAYLRTYAQPGTDTADLACNDIVRLLYADRMMRDNQIPEAARHFSALHIDRLPESVRADAAYKQAWCAYQVESDDAVTLLSNFISSYKDDNNIPDAIALRGICQSRLGKIGEALKDFDSVMRDYPESRAAVVSCQRAAQACSGGGDQTRMIAYYEKLISYKGSRVTPAAVAEAHYNIARALCEEDPAKAVPHFEEASKIDAAHYASRVDVSLVQCYYKMKDADKLHEALVALKKNNSASYRSLPPAIKRWCGWMRSQSRDYANANLYLTDALMQEPEEKYVAADGTEKTRPKAEPLVWKTLAHARLELRLFDRGLEAAEHYVSMETQPYRKADGMRDQAQLLIGLNRTQEAREVCEKAIELGIDGPLKSSIFITLGDAYYAEKEYGEAAKYYGRTANVVNDKELKPQALAKIAIALRKADKAGEAAQYEEQLRTEFPGWTLSVNDSIFMEGSSR